MDWKTAKHTPTVCTTINEQEGPSLFAIYMYVLNKMGDEALNRAK